MLKKFQSVCCVLLAVSMIASFAGCRHNDSSSDLSDEILGSEVIGTGDVGSGGDGNVPKDSVINQQSSKSEVVNNCYKTGYPIAKNKVTLKVMAVDYSNGTDYNKMAFTKFIEKRFNVKLEFQMIDNASVNESVSLALASGNMPDMFWGTGLLNSTTVTRYGSEGRLIKLNNYFADYAPNITKMLNEHKDVKYLATEDDGNIYKIPFYREDDSLWNESLYINKTWLKKLGLNMPKNTNELLNVLRQFRDNDPNGNGKKDEIPLVFVEDVPKGWYGMFGLSTFNHLSSADSNGKITYVPTSTQYKNAISFASSLYSEKLLFNTEMRNVTAAKVKSMIEGSTPTVGIVNATTYSTIMSAKTFLNDYTIMPIVDGTGNGTATWSYMDTEQLWPNWGMITSACKYPEIAVRLVDYFYSTEGAVVAEYGPFGEKMYWKYDSNGKPVINNNGVDYTKLSPWHAIPRYRSKAMLNFFTNESTAKDENTQKANKTEAALKETIYGNLKINKTYNYKYTQAETDELNKAVSSSLNTTVNDWRFQFIYGQKNINNEWSAYVDQLNQLGAATQTKTKLAAADRMQAWIKSH